MTRALPEWRGRTSDTPVPPRVKLRVFERANGCCQKCSRPLRPGHWDTDHRKAIINDGENRETNLQALCDDPCHPTKTKADVAEKSRTYERKLSHVGIKSKGRSFATNRNGPFKRRMSGEIVRR